MINAVPRRLRVIAIEDRPRLRGWLHMVCFFLALPAGVWVIAEAGSTRARIGAVIYAIGLVALFGVSGLYHRLHWCPTWRRRMQSLDHSTIFVMIAGSYTPLCLVALRGWTAVVLLTAVWGGAAAGAVLSWQRGRRSSVARSTLYIALGWVVLLASPQLLTRIEPTALVLIAIGGVLFTVGAITLATRWPDPFPRVFGYHEVWHVLVVAAVVCHLIAISAVLRATGTA
jgi:hemolysin III